MTNKGKAWTLEDEMKAQYMAENGYDIEIMRKELGRTAHAIQKKLAEKLYNKTYSQLQWLAKEPD